MDMDNTSASRGHGRYFYRMGYTMAESVREAERVDPNAITNAVRAGWDAENAEDDAEEAGCPYGRCTGKATRCSACTDS